MRNYRKRFGFTLAEVLITLGVIGVVAALTLPSVVADYRNEQTAVKLEHAYSVVAQALVAAQAEHGDMQSWDFGYTYGADISTVSHITVLNDFANKYFKPYVKYAKDYGYKSFTQLGYDGVYTPINKTKMNQAGYSIILSDGTFLMIYLGTGCDNKDEYGNCTQRSFRNIVFRVDTNGFNPPNVSGRDSFIMSIDLQTHKFTMHNYGMGPRSYYKNYCSSDIDSQVCGYLIMMDGWKIKDDYPWRY